MNTQVDMVQYVERALEAYFKNKREGGPTWERYRLLGALDCALVVVGAMKPGEPFQYKQVEYIAWDWFFVLRRTRRETYAELIIRLAREWLAGKGYDNGSIMEE